MPRYLIANCFAVHFEENLNKVLDKLDTESQIKVQNYRQFSEYSTKKIIENFFSDVAAKQYNDTADLFLYPGGLHFLKIHFKIKQQ